LESYLKNSKTQNSNAPEDASAFGVITNKSQVPIFNDNWSEMIHSKNNLEQGLIFKISEV